MSASSTSMPSGSAGSAGRPFWPPTTTGTVVCPSSITGPERSSHRPTLTPKLNLKEAAMPFARIDLIQGKTPEYRAAVADIVYRGIIDVLKAPDGDRFVVLGGAPPPHPHLDPQ